MDCKYCGKKTKWLRDRMFVRGIVSLFKCPSCGKHQSILKIPRAELNG